MKGWVYEVEKDADYGKPRARQTILLLHACGIGGRRRRRQPCEDDWQAATSDRQASYSNLEPGTYRFEMLASNGNAAWTPNAAVLQFAIAPAFFQTLWFKISGWILGALAILGLIRLQNRRLVWQASASLRDRLKERERIARELHDTLIQDVEAIALNLRAINRRTNEPPETGELLQLEHAAQRSVEVARDRVGTLRTINRSTDTVSEMLRELADQLKVLYPTPFELLVHGTPRRLKSNAEEEILAIAREAILNAFRHAHARVINISIRYTNRSMIVVVSDDGVGLSSEVAQNGAAQGHWGLVGLKERATAIKGQLIIGESPGGGTTMQLTVPARLAYLSRRPIWFGNENGHQ